MIEPGLESNSGSQTKRSILHSASSGGGGGRELKGFLRRMSWLELCKADGKEILELQRLVRRSLKEIQVEQCEGLDIRS